MIKQPSSRLKKFPAIDEQHMLNFNYGEYNLNNQIYFARSNRDNIKDSPISGPNIFHPIDLTQEIFGKIGPLIDVDKNTPKINFSSLEEVKHFYSPTRIDTIRSFILHGALILCYLISNYISLFNTPKVEIVEVTFGLTDKIAQTQQEVDKNEPEGQTEATKTIQDLPQLPKNVSPNTGPRPSTKNEATSTNKKTNLVLKEDKKVTPPVKSEKQELKPKNIGPKVNNTKNNIDEKDYLKRKEEDLRKIAEIKKQGVHGKNQAKPEGQKHTLSTLPKSPFQSTENIPKAPPGLAPTGEESGINVSNYNAYRLYLKNQLRLNWNLHEGSSMYPRSIRTVVEFTINQFGYLMNNPKIVVTSGSKDFDDLAIKAVQGTFPVSTPPPKSIHPPQTFRATYSSKGIE